MTSIISYLPLTTHLFLDPCRPLCRTYLMPATHPTFLNRLLLQTLRNYLSDLFRPCALAAKSNVSSETFAISQDTFLRTYVLPCVRHRIRRLSWLDPTRSDIPVVGGVCSGSLLDISYPHPSMARHIVRIPYPCHLNLNICGAMAHAQRDGSMGNIRGIIFVRRPVRISLIDAERM